MKEAISAQIGKLRNAPFKELNKRYKELFGKAETASHKTYLWRRIVYRLQELEHGGLSQKAKDSLKALIAKYDPINNAAFRPTPSRLNASNSKDRRLPIPGTVINKEYKGSRYQVKILENGFEYRSKIYTSLSAIAKEITGAHWNGYLFFSRAQRKSVGSARSGSDGNARRSRGLVGIKSPADKAPNPTEKSDQ